MDQLLPCDGELYLIREFLSPDAGEIAFISLKESIQWKQDEFRIFGKTMLTPRLTAWYGDPGASYSYSGLHLDPLPWTPLLQELKQQIEDTTGYQFNSVLLNYYRNGNDSMGWHRDNERSLGPLPVIASLSLGTARTMRFRHVKHRSLKMDLILPPGSLLLMAGEIQTYWEHSLPKRKNMEDARINLTFRRIIQS